MRERINFDLWLKRVQSALTPGACGWNGSQLWQQGFAAGMFPHIWGEQEAAVNQEEEPGCKAYPHTSCSPVRLYFIEVS